MIFMARNKDGEFKQFLIGARKKIRPGMTNAPVWVLQKAGKRIWNPKAKRSWKTVDLGKMYRERKHKQKAALRRQKE
jgi:ribosomal protein L39E